MKQLNIKIRQAGFLFILGSFLFVTTSCNNKPNDQEIKGNITTQWQDNKAYQGVNAVVKDGVVTLTGSCEGGDCATEIENKIKEMDGVDSVKNNIQQITETDLTLRTSVQSTISKYPGVQADVAEGVVVLRGSINRDQIQLLMDELKSLNPEKIDNQLAVK